MREKERKSYEKYIGKKFGKLFVKRLAMQQVGGKGVLFECQCDCGNITTPRATAVISGKSKTCKCSWKDGKGSPRILENHIGEKFGNLTITEIVYHGKQRVCLCDCECGNKTKTRYNNLENGSSKSCGCLRVPNLEEKQQNFLKFVEKENVCWIWKGNVSSWDKRYGTYHAKRAHRVAYELFIGPIPKGKHVLHHCDQPLCVSPSCLFLGDALLNAQDMVSKDRHARGERSGMAKLTQEDVVYIRRQMKNGTYGTTLAKELNVSSSAIYNIANYKRWKHVEE